jgi:D-alanyl-D-alanine carboxypeptidase/D-alanyl-D-alanine-endopeptidase (penicillin-binding protein 4)
VNPDVSRPIRLSALVAIAAALLGATAAGASQRPLAVRLGAALSVPHVSARRTAAFALDLRTGNVVFARRAALALAPASTEKLAVSYTALALLGPRYRIETRVVAEGALQGSTWRGPIVLQGKGDPTLSRWDLRVLARRIRAQGITHVAGPVIGDESFFDRRRTATGWRASYYINECAPLSALTVDGGRYRGRISRRPALAAAATFREALQKAGVSVRGRATVGRAQANAVTLAGTSSAPLHDLLRLLDRDSDNFAAEVLLKHLGAAELGRGTTAAGAEVVRRTLDEAGVPLDGVRIVDGSGLSLLDRATVAELVGILSAAWSDPDVQPSFVRSLAVAGRTGTLKRRMRGRAVVAKTGTTSQASALAGFAAGRYAFAVVQNGSPVSWWWARVAQDRFATVLARQ